MTVTEQVFLVALCVCVGAYALGSLAVRLARENLDNPTGWRWLRDAQRWLFVQGLALLVFIAAGALWLAQQWGLVGWV